MLLRNLSKFQGQLYRDKAGEEGGNAQPIAAESEVEATEETVEESAKEPAAEKSDKELAAEAPKGETVKDSSVDAEKSALLQETMKRKQTIKDQEATIADLKASAAQWDGLDVDQVKGLVEASKAAATKELEDKGEFEAIRKQMVEEHSKDMRSAGEKLTASEGVISKLNAHIDELTIGSAFSGSDFISEELTLPKSKARTVYGPHFEVDDKGVLTGYDKPAGAEGRAPIVDASGEPKSFEQAIADIVNADPDKDSLIKSKLKPGAGSDSKASGKPSVRKPAKTGISRISAGINEAGGIPALKQPGL